MAADGLDQISCPVVAGSVVHHHDLEVAVPQLPHRIQAARQLSRSVAGRDDDGHQWPVPGQIQLAWRRGSTDRFEGDQPVRGQVLGDLIAQRGFDRRAHVGAGDPGWRGKIDDSERMAVRERENSYRVRLDPGEIGYGRGQFDVNQFDSLRCRRLWFGDQADQSPEDGLHRMILTAHSTILPSRNGPGGHAWPCAETE